jgi:hypothetical protein
MKVSDLLRSKNCKLLSQSQGNSINNCDFLKFIISVEGGHCDYSPPAPKNATDYITTTTNSGMHSQ